MAPDGQTLAPDRAPASPRAARALAPVAVGTAVATYALVVLGSTVRVTESGMGCSSWPLCNGRIGPIDRFHPLLEQSHRYLASAVTVGVVLVALLAWRSGAPRRVLRFATGALVVVGFQVALGAITVVTHNAPPTVALHLAGGLLLLAATVATATGATDRRRAAAPADPVVFRAGNGAPIGPALTWTALGATFALFVSGSVVVDGGASAACRHWPWCTPAGSGARLVLLQLVHRSLAGLVALLLVVVTVRVLRARPRHPGGARRAAGVLAGLLPLQIAAGALSALSGARPAAQDVHLALAAAIWVCMVALAVTVLLAPSRPTN